MKGLNPYLKVLDRYHIDGLLKRTELDLESYLRENIAKIIYYSSKIEGNGLDWDTSNLILEGMIVPKGGRLQDYIEISNHGKAYEKLVQMSKREITMEDIIELRSTLLKDIIGQGKYEGFRRFGIVNEFNKSTAEQVPVELQRILSILNTRPINTIDAFLNAVVFHALFEELHPFEDGNGRVGRLLMSLYLMKSGLAPILITQENKDVYISGLRSHHAGYYGGLIYQMLFLSLDDKRKRTLLDILDNIDWEDPAEVEFRDIIYSLQKSSYTEEKKKKTKVDIIRLYGLKDKNRNMALAALHIAGLNKVDSDIISMALSDTDLNIRSLAIETVYDVWSEKYIPYLVEIGLNDKQYMNRARALLTLSGKGEIDSSLLSKILEHEKDEAVLSIFLSQLAYSKKESGLTVDTHLIKEILDSNSDSVKSAAYYMLMRYGTDTDVIETSERLIGSGNILVIENSLFSLFVFNKINLDKIAEMVVGLSNESKQVRDVLLGLFDRFPKYTKGGVNDRYNRFLDDIIQSGEDSTERAYAYYDLGTVMGFYYLSEKYKFRINKKNTTVENISLMLAKAPDNRINDTIQLLNIEDNRLNVVGAVELNRLLNNKGFGNDFLLLCSKGLRCWY